MGKTSYIIRLFIAIHGNFSSKFTLKLTLNLFLKKFLKIHFCSSTERSPLISDSSAMKMGGVLENVIQRPKIIILWSKSTQNYRCRKDSEVDIDRGTGQKQQAEPLFSSYSPWALLQASHGSLAWVSVTSNPFLWFPFLSPSKTD